MVVMMMMTMIMVVMLVMSITIIIIVRIATLQKSNIPTVQAFAAFTVVGAPASLRSEAKESRKAA